MNKKEILSVIVIIVVVMFFSTIQPKRNIWEINQFQCESMKQATLLVKYQYTFTCSNEWLCLFDMKTEDDCVSYYYSIDKREVKKGVYMWTERLILRDTSVWNFNRNDLAQLLKHYQDGDAKIGERLIYERKEYWLDDIEWIGDLYGFDNDWYVESQNLEDDILKNTVGLSPLFVEIYDTLVREERTLWYLVSYLNRRPISEAVLNYEEGDDVLISDSWKIFNISKVIDEIKFDLSSVDSHADSEVPIDLENQIYDLIENLYLAYRLSKDEKEFLKWKIIQTIKISNIMN
jgi:hypothetical protein